MDEAEEQPILVDEGAVSEVTRGNAFLWPWYELGVPPFDHWCPIC